MAKPSNVNNVETFANVPIIITKGADWFQTIGSEKSKGTKVFALAGQINNVGLIEVPMGTTLRDIIFEIGGGIKGGRQFKAVQIGGPSGGCLTTKHLDTPIDYDSLVAAGSMMGSGGMVVMDETSCMVTIAKFYLEFTCEESCGKCSPCRIGNKRMLEILEKITDGRGTMEDLQELRNLAAVIKDTALCGLGHAPLCRNCDAYHCRRCVWLNRKMTWDINTPSRQQCVMAHLERNASRSLLNDIRNIGEFMPQIDIKEINYLDPFEVRMKF